MSEIFYTYYKQMGNKILLRYKKQGDNKTHYRYIDKYNPTLWEPDSSSDSGVTDIHGNPVRPVKFDSLKSARDYIKQVRNVDGFNLQGNSRYDNQMIIELFDGQMPNYNSSLIRGAFLDIEVDAEEFPKPHEAKWPVNAITVYDTIDKVYYVFELSYKGSKYTHNKDNEFVGQYNVISQTFDDESSLMLAYLNFWREQNYDYMTGWNTEGFDTPYVYFRMVKLFGDNTAKKLSPVGRVDVREVFGQYGKVQHKVKYVGIPDLDYMSLYKKHTFTPRDSYKLDHIGHVEVGTRKISYEESGSLHNLWRDNPQKFIEYNIYDVGIVKQLDDKLGLIDLTFTLAYYSLSNYEDTLGTTQIWEKLVAKYLYNNRKVPYFQQPNITPRDYEGAYVKAPVVGKHDWIVSLDLASLYPHLEMQFNIGPETRLDVGKALETFTGERLAALKRVMAYRSTITVDKLVEGIDPDIHKDLELLNVAMAANGELYSREKPSFFSAIKDNLYSERSVNKGKKKKAKQASIDATTEQEKHKYTDEVARYDNLQMAQKILLNGGYGALANENFLYYEVENAEAITLSGQLVNRYTSERAEAYLRKITKDDKHNFWVYSDTDSMYLSLTPIVDKVKKPDDDQFSICNKLDIFTEKSLIPQIDEISKELAKRLNAYEQRMVWEREVIAVSAIWQAKKRYTAAVLDNEGVVYNEPDLKVMGLESVKSSTPEWSRKALVECYEAALLGDEEQVQDIVKRTREAFMSASLSDIAIPRGVNNIDKYFSEEKLYLPRTPKHVKAALLHNHLVRKMKINHIPEITDGSKIKYLELKEPNPLNCNALGFETFFPKEFELYERLVDKELMFDKSFLSPLQMYLDCVKWSHKKVVRIDDFFA